MRKRTLKTGYSKRLRFGAVVSIWWPGNSCHGRCAKIIERFMNSKLYPWRVEFVCPSPPGVAQKMWFTSRYLRVVDPAQVDELIALELLAS